MSGDMDCPNGCDLATFGTHQGQPDCDLQPADPGASLVNAFVTIDGQRRLVEVALSSSALREAVQEAR